MKILARDQGFVTTLLGRRRYLPELTARNGALRSAGERMAINMPIQGTAADGMKIAMVRLDAAMRERGLRSQMLLQVHDELVFETDEDELPALAALATEIMEAALPLDVPLEVELKVGDNWEQMDRYRQDDGRGVAAACRRPPARWPARRPRRRSRRPSPVASRRMRHTGTHAGAPRSRDGRARPPALGRRRHDHRRDRALGAHDPPSAAAGAVRRGDLRRHDPPGRGGVPRRSCSISTTAG